MENESIVEGMNEILADGADRLKEQVPGARLSVMERLEIVEQRLNAAVELNQHFSTELASLIVSVRKWMARHDRKMDRAEKRKKKE